MRKVRFPKNETPDIEYPIVASVDYKGNIWLFDYKTKTAETRLRSKNIRRSFKNQYRFYEYVEKTAAARKIELLSMYL